MKDRPEVELVDPAVFGRQTRLVWREQRWVCPDRAARWCSWTSEHPAISSPRLGAEGPGRTVGDATGWPLGPHRERGCQPWSCPFGKYWRSELHCMVSVSNDEDVVILRGFG